MKGAPSDNYGSTTPNSSFWSLSNNGMQINESDMWGRVRQPVHTSRLPEPLKGKKTRVFLLLKSFELLRIEGRVLPAFRTARRCSPADAMLRRHQIILYTGIETEYSRISIVLKQNALEHERKPRSVGYKQNHPRMQQNRNRNKREQIERNRMQQWAGTAALEQAHQSDE